MTTVQPAAAPRPRRRWRRWGLCAGVFAGVILALFVVNGLLLARGDRPVVGDTGLGAAASSTDRQFKIMAWNLAKCFVYDGGVSFASRQQVERRLEAMARLVRSEDPDLLFLSTLR